MLYKKFKIHRLYPINRRTSFHHISNRIRVHRDLFWSLWLLWSRWSWSSWKNISPRARRTRLELVRRERVEKYFSFLVVKWDHCGVKIFFRKFFFLIWKIKYFNHFLLSVPKVVRCQKLDVNAISPGFYTIEKNHPYLPNRPLFWEVTKIWFPVVLKRA